MGDWLKGYQDDHKAVLLLIEKLEGSLMDLKAGLATPNTWIEFEEFADVIKNVIIPHFKDEEKNVYVETAKYGEDEKRFTDEMIQEHEALYALFEQYFKAINARDTDILLDISRKLETVLRHHIYKEEDELPNLARLLIK